MTELNRLPPDQRAVLSLVLDRGKSYSQVADMLAIPESAVRDRAHAALDALASGAAGGGGAAQRPPSGSARAAGGASGDGPVDEPRPLSEVRQSSPPSPPRSSRAPSSRMGGALLLGAIVAVIVIAVILISSGGKGKSQASPGGSAANTHSSSTARAGTPKLNKTIKLTATEPTLKAAGEAYVLSQGGRRAFYVAIQGLPPSSGFFYAVWLYTSPSRSAPLGRAPTVSSSGRMEGGGPLPTNAGSYQQLIITRETSTHPSRPGPIVMRGTFALS